MKDFNIFEGFFLILKFLFLNYVAKFKNFEQNNVSGKINRFSIQVVSSRDQANQ